MKIRLKSQVDYEFDDFRFRVSTIEKDTANRVLRAFHDLGEARISQSICDCAYKDTPYVEKDTDKNELSVVFGWFCAKCVQELERMLTANVPEVLSCTVGANRSVYSPPIHREIEYRSSIAEFEDGRQVKLLPFAIQKYAVTIGQFSDFVTDTGYVTTAEMNGRYGNVTYRKGPTIDPIKPRDRVNLPACSVSYLDAIAYCNWAKQRLPSEAELLAASLIDNRIMGLREKSSFLFGSDGRFRASIFPDALQDLGPQWVDGLAADGYAVVRVGPFMVRELEWKSRQNRYEWPVDGYDLMCGFRTCRTIAEPTM